MKRAWVGVVAITILAGAAHASEFRSAATHTFKALERARSGTTQPAQEFRARLQDADDLLDALVPSVEAEKDIAKALRDYRDGIAHYRATLEDGNPNLRAGELRNRAWLVRICCPDERKALEAARDAARRSLKLK